MIGAMSSCLRTVGLKSPGCTELYISATPEPGDSGSQAEQVFAAVAGVLRDSDARIVYERVFVAPGGADAVAEARSTAYGNLDDGVRPAMLAVGTGQGGPIPGVQVHAVAGGNAPEPIELGGSAGGRIVRCDDFDFLAVSGLSAPDAGDATDQAKAILEKAQAAVEAAGGNMLSIARTWMWLGDILDWYDQFNDVRNEFFRDCGLLGAGIDERLPASTGVGVGPALGGACCMDLVATIDKNPRGSQFLLEGGNQGSAFSYGSAFSRAARARTPAGQTVYVSGTASIDADGRTTHVGDIAAQLKATIKNVRAVLADMNCRDQDVTQSVVYCMTPEFEQVFHEQFGDLPWPRTVVISDICRRDLLAEIEAVACPGATTA